MAKVTKKKNWIKRIRKVFLWGLISSILYALFCRWFFPVITLTQLSSLFMGQGLKREYVSWEHIAPSVKLAAIASEDQLFAQHSGYDWRALKKSLNTEHKKKNNRLSGAAASTISQQTAKNVFLWQGRGWHKYVRKGFEFYFTTLIECCWNKKRILEVYLNVIEMGPGIYGIEAAAQEYFHKPASKLNQKEAAMIIACLPNPQRFTVVPMSKRVSWRYPQILKQMKNIQSDPQLKELTE